MASVLYSSLSPDAKLYPSAVAFWKAVRSTFFSKRFCSQILSSCCLTLYFSLLLLIREVTLHDVVYCEHFIGLHVLASYTECKRFSSMHISNHLMTVMLIRNVGHLAKRTSYLNRLGWSINPLERYYVIDWRWALWFSGRPLKAFP